MLSSGTRVLELLRGVQGRTAELREAARKADAAAEKLADAAEKAQAAQPSTGRTVLNAVVWAGTAFLVGCALNKGLQMMEEARENRQRFPRGTEGAEVEPS